MLAIAATKLGRRFNDAWVFRNLDFEVAAGGSLAVLGHNGSGKSTLMKILAGHLNASEGLLSFTTNKSDIEVEQVYAHISWCAPYIESYGHLIVEEVFKLHFHFKQCLLTSVADCMHRARLHEHRHKRLRDLSSGQGQRAYLALALFSQSSLLLLDEPTSHMDADNAGYAMELVSQYRNDRTLIVASNQPREYDAIQYRLKLG